MNEQRPKEEGLFERIKEYIQLRTRLAVLITAEKIAEFYAGLVTNIILLLCLVMAFLFGSLALAFYLSELFNSNWCGFLCVMGIYLLLALIIQLIRKKSIEQPLMDHTVRKFFAEKNEQDYGK
ncbi:MAG: phage holin family protein [Sphingobacteriaceae bacterium]